MRCRWISTLPPGWTAEAGMLMDITYYGASAIQMRQQISSVPRDSVRRP